MQTEPPQLFVVNFYGGQSGPVFTALRINGCFFELKMRKNMVVQFASGTLGGVTRSHRAVAQNTQ